MTSTWECKHPNQYAGRMRGNKVRMYCPDCASLGKWVHKDEAGVVRDIPTVPRAAEYDYSGMTVPDLRAAAKDRGLHGYSSMKKAELIEALSSESVAVA